MASIIEEMDGMLRDYAAALDPVLVTPVRFTCARCGACCKDFIAGVSIADVRSWIDSRNLFPLAFVRMHQDRHSFRLLSKAECVAMLGDCSEGLQAWLRAIIPVMMPSDECVFLRQDGTCGIHDCKPIECRLYPVGNYILDAGDITCDPGCFDSIDCQDVDVEAFRAMLSVKRVVDHGIAAFLAIEGPGGTWHAYLSRLLALFENLRATMPGQ